MSMDLDPGVPITDYNAQQQPEATLVSYMLFDVQILLIFLSESFVATVVLR
jgi:hypothetical protein